MENTKIGTCIQMGIKLSPEYLFTAFTGWQKENSNKKEIWQLPQVLEDIACFKYYALDYDPVTTARLLVKEEYIHPNIMWVMGFIGGRKPLKHVFSDFNIKSRTDANLIIPCYSFDTLIDFLKLQEIDALIMDIEGSEFDVLENYSWRILPTFISVEVHTFGVRGNVTREERNKLCQPELLAKCVDRMVDIITEKGYTLIFSEPTNFKREQAMTHELKFLKNE